MAKRSVNLSRIEDTPVSRRREWNMCAWKGCNFPSQGRTHLCERHNVQSHNDYVKYMQYGRARLNLDGWCLMPGCTKLLSELPNLHLCNAHLAIVHKQVSSIEIDQFADVEDGFEDEPEPEVKATPPKLGTVYYVEIAGHIKIGWTSDLTKRMHSYPPNSSLLATHPGTRSDEARLHKRFAHHRTHGREWYAPVPSILHHIAGVKREYGEPETVTFGAQPVEIPEPRPTQYVAMRSRSGASYRR